MHKLTHGRKLTSALFSQLTSDTKKSGQRRLVCTSGQVNKILAERKASKSNMNKKSCMCFIIKVFPNTQIKVHSAQINL